jgi:hypothetical protein
MSEYPFGYFTPAGTSKGREASLLVCIDKNDDADFRKKELKVLISGI